MRSGPSIGDLAENQRFQAQNNSGAREQGQGASRLDDDGRGGGGGARAKWSVKCPRVTPGSRVRRHGSHAHRAGPSSARGGGLPRTPLRVGCGGAPRCRRRAVPRLRLRYHGVCREAGAPRGVAGARAHGGRGVPPGAVPGDAAGDHVRQVRRAGGRAERARWDARAERGLVDGNDLGVFSERTAC